MCVRLGSLDTESEMESCMQVYWEVNPPHPLSTQYFFLSRP